MSGRRGGFGKARALPGQKGYGRSESEKLASQAASMEKRLLTMRAQLAKEKKDWAAAKTGGGGSRWRSGRADRGSLKNYAADTKARRRKKKAQSGGRAMQAPRAAPAPQPAIRPSSRAGRPGSRSGRGPKPSPRLNTKTAPSWNVQQVCLWLTSIGLPQYRQLFEENAIEGSVLMEMGEEDLDYLKINALGHRKMLIGGIAELKLDNRPPSNRRPPPMKSSGGTQTGFTGTERTISVNRSSLPKQSDWTQSQVDPRGRESNMPAVSAPAGNLSEGAYNEAEQRRLFQEAVMEWRGGPAQATGKSTAGTSTQSESKSSRSGHTNEMGISTGTEEGASSGWTNPSFGGASVPRSPIGGGGALLRGPALDEAEEHAKFAQAIDEWRSGGDGKPIKVVRPGDKDSKGPSATSQKRAEDLKRRLQGQADVRRKEMAAERKRLMEAEQKAKVASEQKAKEEKSKVVSPELAYEAYEDTAKPLSYDIWNQEIDF